MRLHLGRYWFHLLGDGVLLHPGDEGSVLPRDRHHVQPEDPGSPVEEDGHRCAGRRLDRVAVRRRHQSERCRLSPLVQLAPAGVVAMEEPVKVSKYHGHTITPSEVICLCRTTSEFIDVATYRNLYQVGGRAFLKNLDKPGSDSNQDELSPIYKSSLGYCIVDKRLLK